MARCGLPSATADVPVRELRPGRGVVRHPHPRRARSRRRRGVPGVGADGRFALTGGSARSSNLPARPTTLGCRLDALFGEFTAYLSSDGGMGKPIDCADLLEAVGFVELQEDLAEVAIPFADQAMLWRWAMTHGYRAFIKDPPVTSFTSGRRTSGRRPGSATGLGRLVGPQARSATPIKGVRIDQGRIHAVLRSNHVRLPLIGGRGRAARSHGAREGGGARRERAARRAGSGRSGRRTERSGRGVASAHAARTTCGASARRVWGADVWLCR
jgi:hypothetical protein